MRALSSVKLPAHGESSAMRMQRISVFQAVDEVPSFNVFYMSGPGLARPTGRGQGCGSRRLALLWQRLMAPKPGNGSWPVGRCG